MGLSLVERDLTSMTLQGPNGHTLKYEILHIFPFTSESKRMGIIVRVRGTPCNYCQDKGVNPCNYCQGKGKPL